MTNRQDALDRALDALNELTARHDAFIAHLAKNGVGQERAGILTVTGKKISATCLGISITTIARPVASDGIFVAYEYSFFADFEGKPVRVFTMFLKKDGELEEMHLNGALVCKDNNDHIGARITDALANSLIKSPVFRPVGI